MCWILDTYYVIIFLRQVAEYNIKSLACNASLHFKSQTMKEKSQSHFQYLYHILKNLNTQSVKKKTLLHIR